MNEQQFRQILHDLAQTAIPDEVNMWDSIETQLEQPKLKRKRQPRRVWAMRIVGIFIALIFLGVGGSILLFGGTEETVFVPISGDNGMVTVGNANLITMLDLTEYPTPDDVNVSVPWAFADGNRIVIPYNVTYASNLTVPQQVQAELYDDQGQQFAPASFLLGGGGGGGGSDEYQMFGSDFSFDARHLPSDTQQLSLRLVMHFTYGDPNATMGGGGGGGGGEGFATPVPTKEVAPFDVEFRFDIPFYAAYRPSTYTNAGSQNDELQVRLTDISIAPSVSTATLCFTSPDVNSLWQPYIISFSAFSPTALSIGFNPQSTDLPTETEVCGEMVMMGEYQAQNGSMVITIDRLQTEPQYTPERIAQFKATLEGIGFEVEIPPTEAGQAVNYMIQSAPADLGEDYYNVVNTVYNNIFFDSVRGPWWFEISVPPNWFERKS